MKSRSNLIDAAVGEGADVVPRKRQRPYRQKIRTLSQVSLDATNVAVLRDLSEYGIALQTVVPLAPNQQVQLRFDLAAPRVRIEAAGRIVWTDSWGQAGVQFLDLPQRSERLLKEWVFSQILSSAYLFSPCEAAAVEGNRAEGAAELLFSVSPRPAIQLEPRPIAPRMLPDPEARPQRFRLQWCPVPVSLNALSKLLDSLILLCAVLLFAVMSMLTTNILPSWPFTVVLAIGITAVFVALYWFLFVFWIGATPGERLAWLACSASESGAHGEAEDQTRFR
jgi:PilZ domain